MTFSVLTPTAVWSDWGDWIETDPSSCSCGIGFKFRVRHCPAPSPDACDGDQTQTEPCTASESINQQTCEKPSGLTSGRFRWISSASLNFLVWWTLKITDKLSDFSLKISSTSDFLPGKSWDKKWRKTPGHHKNRWEAITPGPLQHPPVISFVYCQTASQS